MKTMENIQPRNKTRKKINTVVIFLIIFGILAYWVGIQTNSWWQVKKEYIKMGYASDKFPYKMYTAEELAEKGLYPESLYENVPTRTRPEETYTKFRKALIEEDFDTAAECFINYKKKEARAILEQINNQDLILEMLKEMPVSLEETYKYTEDAEIRDLNKTSLASYYYIVPNDTEREAQTIFFIKNKYGDWLIEDL